VIGVGLLVAFVRWQQRSKNPLLPIRLLINRVRGGSLVALFLTSIGSLASRSSSPITCRDTRILSTSHRCRVLAARAAIALSAFIASARLLGVSGPRPLVPTGMLLSMMGMVLFTKLTPNADYFSNVLPGSS